MARIGFGCLLLTVLIGCQSSKMAKVDNPVLGPPPPRIPEAVAAASEPEEISPRSPDSAGTIQPVVALSESVLAAENLTGHEVVAVINGSPVFASEILDRYKKPLEQMQRELPTAQFIEARNAILKRDLPQFIETRLLADLFRAKIKPEQLDHINGILAGEFEKEVRRMMRELGTESRTELMQKLEEQGTSLDALQRAFTERQLASEYLRSQTKFRTDFPREELLQYYFDHRDEFQIEGQVRWQQIVIDYDKHGGQSGAWQVFRQVAEALRYGAEFEEVGRKYSDGATAANGGNWDWTRLGSLTNKDVEKALFELPVGTISQEFMTDKNIQIVRVVERIDPSVRPFEEVQDEIRNRLAQADRQQALQAKLREIKSSAEIMTIFDES